MRLAEEILDAVLLLGPAVLNQCMVSMCRTHQAKETSSSALVPSLLGESVVGLTCLEGSSGFHLILRFCLDEWLHVLMLVK